MTCRAYTCTLSNLYPCCSLNCTECASLSTAASGVCDYRQSQAHLVRDSGARLFVPKQHVGFGVAVYRRGQYYVLHALLTMRCASCDFCHTILNFAGPCQARCCPSCLCHSPLWKLVCLAYLICFQGCLNSCHLKGLCHSHWNMSDAYECRTGFGLAA